MKKIMLSVLAGMALLSVMTACGPKEKLWSERMAESEMQRFPQLYQFDHGKRLFFGYTQGLGALAMWEMWQYTGDKKYYDYVYQWGDTIIGPEGQIHLFRPQEYNLDFINSGKILFDLYASTGEERFRMAMDTLMDKQMRHQLRTPEGGFWHKKRYTQQMWLDGLYMASPFLAEYGVTFNEPQWIDDVIHQLPVALQLPAGVYNFGSGNNANTYRTIQSVLEELNLTDALRRLTPNLQAFSDSPRDIRMDPSLAASYGIHFRSTQECLRDALSQIL